MEAEIEGAHLQITITNSGAGDSDEDDGLDDPDDEANLRVRMMRGVSQATHMPVQRPNPEERRRKGR